MRKNLFVGLVMTVVLSSAAVLQGNGIAGAATVTGCAQGSFEYRGTCISVVTGTKNKSNRTQYVESITIHAPTEARRANKPSKLEAWAGNGPTGVAWYNTKKGLSVTWTVNKWIKNGSGICGAYTWPGTTNRSIACITIKV